MTEATENCWKPYPLLLIQGNISDKVLLVKIVVEKSLITAESSVEEQSWRKTATSSISLSASCDVKGS